MHLGESVQPPRKREDAVNSVTNQLFVDRVDPDELARILMEKFGGAMDLHSQRERTLAQGNHSLTIKYTKKGAIASITASPGFSSQRLDELRDAVRAALIEDQTKVVSRWVAFSNKPVDRCFRGSVRGISFQLLPPQPGQPISSDVGADHPFILEVEHPSSTNLTIKALRSQQAATVVARTLNLLVRSGIKIQSTHSAAAWTYQATAEPTQWSFLGYRYSPEGPPEFSSAVGIPTMARIDDILDYFNVFGTNYGSVTLPRSIDECLTAVDALSSEIFRKFELAATLFDHSLKIGSASRSAAFLALASAIEALAPQDESECDHCGQPIYKISARFRAFLTRYTQTTSAEADRFWKRLYETRSGLSHGLALLESDIRPWRFATVAAGDQWRHHVLFQSTVRFAIHNWLLDPEKGVDMIAPETAFDRFRDAAYELWVDVIEKARAALGL